MHCGSVSSSFGILEGMLEEESSIERVRKRIYAKQAQSTVHQRRPLHEEAYKVESSWGTNEPASLGESEPNDVSRAYDPWTLSKPVGMSARAGSSSLLRKFTVIVFSISTLFFLVAVGIGGYVYYTGRSEVRPPTLSWSGPLSVGAGDEVLYMLTIQNPNMVPLLAADLRVQFPPGARSPNNFDVALTEYRETLGTIGPRESKTATIRAVLFGPEEATQAIGTTLAYRLTDSETTFTSHSSTTVLLSRAPVSLSVKGVEEHTSGQPLTLTVELASSASKPVRAVALRALYPPGFQVTSVQPRPEEGNEYWKLGDMPTGTKKTFTISGILIGNGGEDRVFRFEVGQEGTKGSLAGVLNTSTYTVALTRPFLDIALNLGEASGEVLVVKPNSTVAGSVGWKNNLAYPLSDVEVEATLKGSILDRQSVQVSNGFYRSLDETLVWTKQTDKNLELVSPGESGTLNFSFQSLGLAPSTGARNPSMTLEISVRAKRIGQDNVPETLERVSTRTVRLETVLTLSPRAVWSVGPFINSGPVPPRADQTTTYTILWSLTNSTNEAKDVELSAELPIYVEWRNVISPEGAEVRFDETSRKVSWRVGAVAAGAGYESQAPEVAFQIAVTPSVAQQGSEISLIESQTLRGVDRFTGSVIETTYPDLTSRLTTDPAFAGQKGTVLR